MTDINISMIINLSRYIHMDNNVQHRTVHAPNVRIMKSLGTPKSY